MRTIAPAPCPNPVALSWAEDQNYRLDVARRWQATGGMTVHRVPGNHKSMWRAENAKFAAERLSRALAEARGGSRQRAE